MEVVSISCTLATIHDVIPYAKMLVTRTMDLSSPVLGSATPGKRDCIHCNGNECYGHIGYIQLPCYVPNPLLLGHINKFLSRTCFKCHKYVATGSICKECSQSINKICIGSNISAEDAMKELALCGNKLQHAISNVVAVVPRMMRPRDIRIYSQHSISNSYDRLLTAASSDAPSFKSIYREYNNLILSNTSMYGSRSIVSLLKGKDGLFRSYMVGKRVDNCGRAVIIGTDLQDFNVVSLPKKIYNKLRLSIRCTDDNMPELLDLASRQRLYTKKGDLVHVISVTVGKRYMRSLYGEDRVLLNRQPSLSKHSLMSFKVERNETNAIIINTCVTGAYAADFDGDEMGIFLQDNDAYSTESKGKMSVESNLDAVSFIQDVVTIYYALSTYPRHISKSIYCDCCLMCERYNIPYDEDFTTRELLSLPFPSTLSYYTDNLTIAHGIITSGSVTKNDLRKIISLVSISQHDVVAYVRKTQSLVSYLTTTMYSISVGLDDIDIVDTSIADDIMSSYDHIPGPLTNDEMRSISSNISDMCTREITRHIKDTSMWNMVLSGSKGNMDNIVHMSIALGYQSINGNPEYLCRSSYLRGLSTEEYVHHQRSSRQGLIGTNVYTADIGYIGRRLCKVLSTTVHDRATGNVVYNNGDVLGMFVPDNLMLDDNILSNI